MEVHDLTWFSDHCSLSFELAIGCSVVNHCLSARTYSAQWSKVNKPVLQLLPEKFIWDSSSGTKFYEVLKTVCNGDIQDFLQKKYDITRRQSVDEMVYDFNSILQRAGRISLKLKKRTYHKRKLPKYADQHCYSLYNDLKQLAKRVSGTKELHFEANLIFYST